MNTAGGFTVKQPHHLHLRLNWWHHDRMDHVKKCFEGMLTEQILTIYRLQWSPVFKENYCFWVEYISLRRYVCQSHD